MTDVRRVTLVAAALWLALHLAQALFYADVHARPALLAVAIVLAAVTSTVAVLPLLSETTPATHPLTSALLVAGGVAVSACVTPFLAPAALLTSANWPNGGVGLVVAALVLRRCIPCAAVLTAALVGISTAAVAHHEDDPALTWLDAGWLAVSPVTWFLGAVGVELVLRRGARLREEYVRRGDTFDHEAHLRSRVSAADAERHRELRQRALPILARIAAEGSTPRLRAEAHLTAEALRDGLKARSLLTQALRDEIAEARARGVRVTVSTTMPDTDEEPPLLLRTREVLGRLLAEAELGSTVSCRYTVEPLAAVLLVGAPTARETSRLKEVLAEVSSGPREGRLSVSLEEYDGEVLLELRATGSVTAG